MIHQFSYTDQDIDGDSFDVTVGANYSVSPRGITIGLDGEEGVYAEMTIPQAVKFAEGIMLAVEIGKRNPVAFPDALVDEDDDEDDDEGLSW